MIVQLYCNNQYLITMSTEHKLGQHHYMEEHIEPNQVNAQEHTGLLKTKEDFLDTTQLKMDQENQTFWLETFGMFIFIYASTCSKFNTGVDLAFFVGIFIAIPICAKQTGANLNPAVSYSMVLKNDVPSTYSVMWIYFKAQVLGAIISMALAIVLNDVYRSPLYPTEFTTGQILRMILSEAVGVFALIFFILYATGPVSFIENNGAKYFYIAVFVYIGRRFAAVSGNQINLALTISQAFVGIPECNYQGFKYLFIWLIGDALGVILAAKFYSDILEPTVIFVKKLQKAREEYKKSMQSGIQLKNINRA